jgi:hypothetical protein
MEKPFVCICDFTIVVTPKKWLNRINNGSQKVIKDTIDKYVYNIKLKDYPITLVPETKKFPTDKTRNRVFKSIWLYSRQKKKYDSVVLQIKDINIKHKSEINYEFDYSKD